MKRFVHAVGFAAAWVIAFAPAAGAQPARGAPQAVCAYQAGSPFSAEIRISVMDREVQADSAVVRLNGTIPGGGRAAPGAAPGAPARYVAALQTMPVQLQNDSLKRFNIAPRVVVENANSPLCVLRIESTVGNRGWALDTVSDFTFETIVTVNGRQETTRTQVFTSCFDEDTPVRLASGELAAAKELVPGDLVWNPVSRKEMRVREVIQGTQADETLYRVGYADSSVLFTAQHPVMTRKGPRAASGLTRDDEILGEDGAFHPLAVLETRAGDPKRLVYNLALEAPENDWDAHWIAAGGIVAGDFFLQEAAQYAD